MQEVRDLSAKLNQVLGTVATLTKQVNTPSILQEATGAQSAPDSVSGDSISSGLVCYPNIPSIDTNLLEEDVSVVSFLPPPR